MAEETIILNLEIDQSNAQKQLLATEKAILALKKEQADLNKEYKAGKISEDQYIESNQKLQRSLKAETAQKATLNKLLTTESNSRNAVKLRTSELVKEYDNLNRSTAAGAKRAEELEKELKQLSATISDTSKKAGLFKDQIGNYPDKFTEAAKSIDVAGVSVNGLTTKFAGVNGAVTAAVGILGSLVALYANSASGARDLEFAQNQLAAATGILSESFSNFINNGEESIGLVSQLTGAFLFALNQGVAVESAIIAAAQQRQKQLEIARGLAQGFAKEDERRAEIARRLRDDETKSLQERLEASKEITPILERSAERTITVIQAQIDAVKGSTVAYDKNLEAQLHVAQLEAEISDKREEITGKLTENVTAQRNLNKAIAEEIALNKGVSAADKRLSTGVNLQSFGGGQRTGETPEEVVAAQDTQKLITQAMFDEGQIRINQTEKINNDILALNKRMYLMDLQAANAAAQAKTLIEEAQLNSTISILNSAASLFDQQSAQYKIFATAQALISTYAAATKAYEAAFVPPTIASPAIGAAYAAAAIAQGLANVAAINGVQFAEGGWTGPGSKYQAVGIVHADEYVVPKHIVNSPVGKQHINALETARVRGYADGGFVTNQNSQPSQNALITANAIKNQPPVYVSWVEGQKVGRRVEFREQTSKR